MIVPRYSSTIRLKSFFQYSIGIRRFHNEFETPKRLFFSSASQGLCFFLKALRNIKNRGLRVAVPVYCCESVFAAITSAQCSLILYESVCTSTGYKTSYVRAESIDVVIVVHLFGIPFIELSVIRNIFPGALIVEDCSHLSLREYHPQIGSIAAIYSFNFHKPISSGTGGCLEICDESFAKRLRKEYLLLSKSKFGLYDAFIILLKDLAYSKYIYSFIYKSLERRRNTRQPLTFQASSCVPKKMNRLQKAYIGNQSLISNGCFGRNMANYRLFPEEVRLSTLLLNNTTTLIYYPLFLGEKTEEVIQFLHQLKVDCFMLWSNCTKNVLFYGVSKVDTCLTSQFMRTSVFLPATFLTNKNMVIKLLLFLEKYKHNREGVVENSLS